MAWRMLIVDDQPVFQEVARRLFGAHSSLMVKTACTLAEAHFVVDQGDIDIVVLDINLPDGDVFETVSGLRASTPDLTIILTSASNEPVYHQLARSAGADVFVEKSALSADTLLGLVQESIH